VEAVFVAEWEMVEKIFYGFDAAIGEVRGYAVADAFDVFDRGVEVERHGLMVAVVVVRNAGVFPLRLRSESRMTTRNKQQRKQKRRWIIGWTQHYGIFSCPV